ncbi:MAG: hypothetical protein RL208_189 [Pseudomonadota bacterium]|jgi:nicotinamide mononucleotide adenylyltransferase
MRFVILLLFLNSCAKKYKLAIYHNSFQPFHHVHYDVIKRAKKSCEHLVIGILHAKGEVVSEYSPFYGDDREKMIKDTLEKDGMKNYSIVQYNYQNENGYLRTYYESIYDVATKEYKRLFGVDYKDGDIASIYDANSIYDNWRKEEYFPILHIKPDQDSYALSDEITRKILTNCNINDKLPYGTKMFFKQRCNKFFNTNQPPPPISSNNS